MKNEKKILSEFFNEFVHSFPISVIQLRFIYLSLFSSWEIIISFLFRQDSKGGMKCLSTGQSLILS